MDPSSLTTALWIALLRWALHVTVAPEAVDAIAAAARANGVPEARLFALCFVESTLGQGRAGLLCGYQGRISEAERAAWPYGGEVARSNARWQAAHAASALARWRNTVCTRGSSSVRWDGAASFYNTGRSCAPNDYARRVAGVSRRVEAALARRDRIAPEACASSGGEAERGCVSVVTEEEAPCEH